MTDTPPAIDPRHSAMLVMDFQISILNNLPDHDELLSRVAAAVATARGHGVQIGHVRVAFDDSDLRAIPDTNKAFTALAGRPGFLRLNTPDTAIHERLAPKPGDIVVRKTRVGAFSTTNLDAQLRARSVNTLILAGVSTSGVVLSTVRDAADRDYRIFVLSDGVADSDSEVHDVLTRKVLPRQAHVITTAELPGLLQAK